MGRACRCCSSFSSAVNLKICEEKNEESCSAFTVMRSDV